MTAAPRAAAKCAVGVEFRGVDGRTASGMAAVRSAGTRRAGGFTIVELAAVLVLVALVSTVAIRSWFARSDVTLENAAELLASDLRHMQTRATVRQVPVAVVFHADQGGYHGQDLGRSDGVEETRRYPHDAVFEDVRIDAVRFRQGDKLVFDSLGRPNVDVSITLVHHGVARTVLVDARRARVAVEGDQGH